MCKKRLPIFDFTDYYYEDMSELLIQDYEPIEEALFYQDIIDTFAEMLYAVIKEAEKEKGHQGKSLTEEKDILLELTNQVEDETWIDRLDKVIDRKKVHELKKLVESEVVCVYDNVRWG